MGRIRRSVTTYRHAPYNLRSRSRVKYDSLSSLLAGDDNPKEYKKRKILPTVSSLTLCAEENAAAHHTDVYQTVYLVLRRGQPFTFRIKFNKKLDSDENVRIVLSTGRSPYASQGTLLFFQLRNSAERFGWKMTACSPDEQDYELKFVSPSDAVIGKYSVSVQISSESSVKTSKLKETFCLVFNPWNSEDDTYMEGSAERDEYVMNETGRIFVGSKSSKHGRPWIFGQFEECCLESALHILNITDLADAALSNPVLITRAFSKMANSFDDDGILCGNWTGDYSGGVEPTDWISSVDILQQYWETKKDVKYGQCWVFSGILTSLLRAVGIPARCITNFESAHDNDGSMTIDRHWNYDDTPLADLNDSVWNFHVWNEVWLKREDLPDGHDGWQAVDGTPQEASEGVMQCGPASVRAIKEGEVYLPYDSKFIIAEVNGDIIEWVKDKAGEMIPVYRDRNSIGYFISTKAVGSSDREDVTENYKYKEGSSKENAVTTRIVKYSSRKQELLRIYKADVSEKVKFKLDGAAKASGNVCIKLNIHNTDDKKMDIDVKITCVSTYYNGSTGDQLLVMTENVQVEAGREITVDAELAGKDYLNRIATDSTVAVFCTARVLQTGQCYFKKESYQVDRPDIQLVVPDSVSANEQFSVDFSYTNQLDIDLTECRLRIDGPGLQPLHPTKLFKSTISAGETINQTLTFKARSVGVKELVSLLHTRQLQNLTGSAIITVT